jgi:ribosome-associated protein
VEAIKKVTICGKYAEEKKAKDVLVLELGGLTDISDYFLLVSGTSERHVRTISEYIKTGMKDIGVMPYSVEGYNDGRWVIIDYQNVIIHIFLETLRELYDLESLWIEAKRYRMDKENIHLEVENDEGKA